MSQERIESTDDEIEVDMKGRELTSDREADHTLDQSDEFDPDIQEMSMDFSDKTGHSSDDDGSKDSPRNVVLQSKTEENLVENVEEKSAVVILRKKDSAVKQDRDSTKRQTIAGESGTEATPFGERKVKRSSLIMENRNWDDLGKPKDKVEEEPTNEEQGSEFASVFAKFRKQASQKKTEVDKIAESLETKRSSAVFKADKSKSPVVKKVSDGGAVTIGFNTQAKPVNNTQSATPAKDKYVSSKPSVKGLDESRNKMAEKKEAKVVAVEKKESIIVSKPQSFAKQSNDMEKDKASGIVKRQKPEKKQEEGKRDSGLKRTSAELVSKRVSGEIVSKRTSGEITTKRTSGEITTKRTSAEITAKRTSGENITKRTSGEVSKSMSVEAEPKRNSGENFLKADGAKKVSPAQVPTADSENKTVMSSKFVSVHSRSVKLNDTKKIQPVAKMTTSPKVDSSSSGANVKTVKTKEPVKIHASGGEKTSDGSVTSSGNNNLNTKSSAAHKRDSPRIANRLRSPTLPESAASKTTQSPSDSQSLKRANSQDGGVNKENIPAASQETSPKKTSVVRSSVSSRPTPQKLGGGAQPSWIDMARKRTEGFNEDQDKGSENKTSSVSIFMN
jgi:hypothetical protein